MIIGTTDVHTPYPELGGDPTFYDPDFRAKIAYELGTNITLADLPPQLSKNQAMIKHAKFIGKLRDAELNPLSVYREYATHGLVHNWAACNNGSPTRYYLDALLLTDQPISVIADDLRVSEESVRLYSQLYFDCRDPKDYSLKLSARTKTAFALGPLLEQPRTAPIQTQWRIIALHLGYSGLVYRWGWEKDAHGEFSPVYNMQRNLQLAAMELESRIRTGNCSNEDLVSFISTCIDYERLVLEKDQKTNSGQQGMELLRQLLTCFAPAMIDNARTLDQMAIEQTAVEQKRLAESNISAQTVDDRGTAAGEEAVRAQLHAKFKDFRA